MKGKTFVVAEPLSPKRSLSRCCPLVGSSSSKHSKNSKYSKNSKHSKYHEQRCGNPAPLAPKFSDFPPTHTRKKVLNPNNKIKIHGANGRVVVARYFVGLVKAE